MKKLAMCFLSLLLITALVTGCGSEPLPSGEPSTEVPTTEAPGTEAATTEAPATEAPTTEIPTTQEPSTEAPTQPEVEIPLDEPIKVLYCTYTEKPYFALVGTCTEGATVIGEVGGESYSSKSYKGCFSLRLPCESGRVEVSLTQTTGPNHTSEPLSYTASPKAQEAGRWPVVTGGDFQFFLQKMLPDYRHENIDSQEAYAALTERVRSRLETIHSYNPQGEIIYLIVPSTMSVYPELVPEEYAKGAGDSRLDLVSQTLRDAGATVIDLKSAFVAHKNDEMPLYYKLDSHWSDYGAFVAYQELFAHISQKFPDAAPRALEEFQWKADYYRSGDMSYYLGMAQSKVKEYGYYRSFAFDAPSSITSIPRYRSSSVLTYNDAVTYEKWIGTQRPELPSCMVIRDSYATQIYDLIAERMDNTHFLGMWNYTWNSTTIKSEKPDYVIYLVAEWNIDALMK